MCIRDSHTGGAAEEPVPAAGGTQQRHHGKAGRGTVPERRGSGHHFQTVERHQETGNRSGAGGHHLRVLLSLIHISYVLQMSVPLTSTRPPNIFSISFAFYSDRKSTRLNSSHVTRSRRVCAGSSG